MTELQNIFFGSILGASLAISIVHADGPSSGGPPPGMRPGGGQAGGPPRGEMSAEAREIMDLVRKKPELRDQVKKIMDENGGFEAALKKPEVLKKIRALVSGEDKAAAVEPKGAKSTVATVTTVSSPNSGAAVVSVVGGSARTEGQTVCVACGDDKGEFKVGGPELGAFRDVADKVGEKPGREKPEREGPERPARAELKERDRPERGDSGFGGANSTASMSQMLMQLQMQMQSQMSSQSQFGGGSMGGFGSMGGYGSMSGLGSMGGFGSFGSGYGSLGSGLSGLGGIGGSSMTSSYLPMMFNLSGGFPGQASYLPQMSGFNYSSNLGYGGYGSLGGYNYRPMNSTLALQSRGTHSPLFGTSPLSIYGNTNFYGGSTRYMGLGY